MTFNLTYLTLKAKISCMGKLCKTSSVKIYRHPTKTQVKPNTSQIPKTIIETEKSVSQSYSNKINKIK